MSPIFLLLKSRRNTYLHPLIKFLLPNTLPFGKTWWAPSQNLPHNTKNGFIKSQSKQVCLSCCIKKISSYLLMGFLHHCLIPINTLIYMLWFPPSIKRVGAQDKWLHLTLKKHPLSHITFMGLSNDTLRAIPAKQVYGTLLYCLFCGGSPVSFDYSPTKSNHYWNSKQNSVLSCSNLRSNKCLSHLFMHLKTKQNVVVAWCEISTISHCLARQNGNDRKPRAGAGWGKYAQP